MKSIFSMLILSGLVVTLIACSSTPANTQMFVLEPTNTRIKTSPTEEPTQTPVTPSPTVTEKPLTKTATLEAQTTSPTPTCVQLHYAEYAQFEIISPSGQRVLVDIHDPTKLTSPAVENDILLTTHTHWDHLSEDFHTTFPGSQLFVQTGTLKMPATIVQGISSAHNVGDKLKTVGGTNYIYLIEIGGLRIVHFGDIGQATLNEEQMILLDDVDVAIAQINNPYSDMNAENHKGINLLEQVQPRLVIPTHLNLDTVKLAAAQWDGFFTKTSSIQICESDLSQGGTQFLLMGEAAEVMTNYVDLVRWENR